VTKKDHTMTKHPQIEVPNLHVCKLMQSLRSREVVKEKFNCQNTGSRQRRQTWDRMEAMALCIAVAAQHWLVWIARVCVGTVR
jgi:hypothetical protein